MRRGRARLPGPGAAGPGLGRWALGRVGPAFAGTGRWRRAPGPGHRRAHHKRAPHAADSPFLAFRIRCLHSGGHLRRVGVRRGRMPLSPLGTPAARAPASFTPGSLRASSGFTQVASRHQPSGSGFRPAFQPPPLFVRSLPLAASAWLPDRIRWLLTFLMLCHHRAATPAGHLLCTPGRPGLAGLGPAGAGRAGPPGFAVCRPGFAAVGARRSARLAAPGRAAALPPPQSARRRRHTAPLPGRVRPPARHYFVSRLLRSLPPGDRRSGHCHQVYWAPLNAGLISLPPGRAPGPPPFHNAGSHHRVPPTACATIAVYSGLDRWPVFFAGPFVRVSIKFCRWPHSRPCAWARRIFGPGRPGRCFAHCHSARQPLYAGNGRRSGPIPGFAVTGCWFGRLPLSPAAYRFN